MTEWRRLTQLHVLSNFIRHAPEIWPSYDRSLWESFHSPLYRKPVLGTSYTYIEFTESGEGAAKKETKDVGDGGKESAKSAEKFVDDRESFKVSFDVSKFKPEEITIRSEDGELLVEGKQEAKNEGYSTRHFVRSYSLPRNIDRDSFQSRLSKEGILSIEAKKLQKPEAKDNFIKIETED